MAMNKVKKDDTVIVIAGKDKGRVGKVIRVLIKKGKAVIEGINIVSKNVKPNPERKIEGGITQKEMPIDLSNVALLNLASNKADRVGFKTLEDGRKVRYFKSSGEVVDV